MGEKSLFASKKVWLDPFPAERELSRFAVYRGANKKKN